MRILYVSQYFPPEMGAPAARVHELSKHWAALGHSVTVLTGFPNHPTGVIAPEYKRRFRRMFWRERIDGIDVVRTWLWPLPNRKSHERILNYTSFFLSAALRGLFLRRPDVIVATSPQLLVGLAGWWLGLVKRAPVIFEVRDIWPDAILASGVSHEGSLLAKALRALSRFLHRVCDHVVVVTPAFERDLVTRWKVPPHKISVVLNGVETESFRPSEDPAADKAAFDLADSFVVSYVGTLGYAHGLDVVLDVAADLAPHWPDLDFVLVGEGAERDHLEDRVRNERLGNVRLLPQQPRDLIPRILGASDVCLVPLKRADIFETVIPTKMLECMAAARPIVLGVDGEARRLLEEAGAGLFVEPEDASALRDAILKLRTDDVERKKLGAAGREYIVGRLSREATARDYVEILDRVVNGAGSAV